MIVDPGDALAEFIRLVQPAVCPTLSEEEQHLVLDRHKRGYLWQATTAIQLGTVVIPTLANRTGHRYKLIEYTTTGTTQQSGATEPSWPTTREGEVVDGSLRWREDGYDWNGVLWDFRAAAYEGWILKAAKSVTAVDTQAEQLSVKSSQLYDHCMKMAERFQPVYVL